MDFSAWSLSHTILVPVMMVGFIGRVAVVLLDSATGETTGQDQ